MDELFAKSVANDGQVTPGAASGQRWSSCDVAHVEIPLAVSGDAGARVYRPILTCLGYAPASERPGLARWVSGTGRSSLVLIETAAHTCEVDDEAPKPNTARGLVFEADRRERIDTLHELLLSLGLAILVPPPRYSSRDDEYGLVWCDPNGFIFELRYRARTTSTIREPTPSGHQHLATDGQHSR